MVFTEQSAYKMLFEQSNEIRCISLANKSLKHKTRKQSGIKHMFIVKHFLLLFNFKFIL